MSNVAWRVRPVGALPAPEEAWPMQTAASHQLSRSAAAAGQHVYLRPSVRPLPRPRLVESTTW